VPDWCIVRRRRISKRRQLADNHNIAYLSSSNLAFEMMTCLTTLSVSSSGYTASNCVMSENYQLERICKETVVVSFEVISRRLPGETGEKPEKSETA
jgi:hypothetical protein